MPELNNTSEPTQSSPSQTPFLTMISIMWGVTLGQFVLQMTGPSFVAKLCGFVGFVMALYLATRGERAASINGGLHLGLWALGLIYHLLSNR